MLPDHDTLSDSVTDARSSNLREDKPDLFGDAPPKSALADLDDGTVAAIAGDEDADEDTGGTPADEGGDVPERDPKTGQFVPRARVDELTAQRNKERERADAAEAKAADLERKRQEQEEAVRAAAEAKAKEVHDFDADRDALQAKFDANEIDLGELNREMRKLDKAEREQDRRIAKDEALAELRKEQQADRERADRETFEEVKASAESAAAAFLEKPENAAYKTDKFRIAAFNSAREEIFAEKDGDIGWDELNEQAKARVEAYLGEAKPKAKGETEAERVARERREKQAVRTAEMSVVPSKPLGGVGARATAEPEDENNLSTDEWRKLSKAERDKRLGKVA